MNVHSAMTIFVVGLTACDKKHGVSFHRGYGQRYQMS